MIASCVNCEKADPDFAHGVFEAVAATLAEPLRRAFGNHLAAHGCGTGDIRDPRYIGGFGECPGAMALFELLPPWDKAVIAGPVVSAVGAR